MLTLERRVIEEAPITKKSARSKATKEAMAMRAKHIRPNRKTKEKAAKVRAKDATATDILKIQIPVEPVILARLSSMMLTVAEIANFCGVSLSTMNRRLRKPELREAYLAGRAHAKANLHIVQFNNALTGNTQMQIWLGKQYLGQKNEHAAPVSDEDALPNIEDDNMVSVPWNDDLKARLKEIDEQFSDVTGA